LSNYISSSSPKLSLAQFHRPVELPQIASQHRSCPPVIERAIPQPSSASFT
jgi:hypothetical protein